MQRFKKDIESSTEGEKNRAKALSMLEKLGVKRRAPFQVVYHPRHFNKPSSCKDGLHRKLETKVLMGIPILYCSKCGEFVYKGAYEGNVTKEEMRAKVYPAPKLPSTEEMAIMIFETLQEKQRK